MKVRTDFVTNSSSSSFIFTFQSREEMKEKMQQIREKCSDLADCLEYNRKQGLLPSERERLANTVRYVYIVDYLGLEEVREETCKALGLDKSRMNWHELHKLEDTEKYNEIVDKRLKEETNYFDIKDKIMNDKIVIYCTVWDNDCEDKETFGVKVRNDYLRQNFSDLMLIQWDIG